MDIQVLKREASLAIGLVILLLGSMLHTACLHTECFKTTRKLHAATALAKAMKKVVTLTSIY